MSAVHLRAGDVVPLPEVYTNRKTPTPQLAAALRRAWREGGYIDSGTVEKPAFGRPYHRFCLAKGATAGLLGDRCNYAVGVARASRRARHAGASRQVLFRTPHGSHGAAFAMDAINGKMEMPLPAKHVVEHLHDKSEQENVRFEALFDIYMLSALRGPAGAASSMFAVAARLWGLEEAQRLHSAREGSLGPTSTALSRESSRRVTCGACAAARTG